MSTNDNLKSSILNHNFSNVTVTPELVAPIPIRHPELQALDMHARNWPSTSSPASSSRAISPASPMRSTVGLYRNSLASLAEADGTVASARDEAETGAGRRWIRWMHKNSMKGWVVPAVLVAGALVRWCVGLGSYSGACTCQMSIMPYAEIKQARVHRRCTATTRLNGTGWN